MQRPTSVPEPCSAPRFRICITSTDASTVPETRQPLRPPTRCRHTSRPPPLRARPGSPASSSASSSSSNGASARASFRTPRWRARPSRRSTSTAWRWPASSTSRFAAIRRICGCCCADCARCVDSAHAGAPAVETAMT